MQNLLKNKKGLIIGIANEQSIAYGCANICHNAGAELAITYFNNKTKPYVLALAENLDTNLYYHCDVRKIETMHNLYNNIAQHWQNLDFIIHSVGYISEKNLHAKLLDCNETGFLEAIAISCFSFVNFAKIFLPLMKKGGSLITMSYYGANQVMANYGLMGPVKACLESSVRYLAAELASSNIRVNAVSPGPINTRAATVLPGFANLLMQARQKSPQKRIVTINDVANLVAFLVSDKSNSITGDIHYVDGGYHIMD